METNSFLKSLFDLEMKEHLTLKIIKPLYTIGIGIAGIVGVALVISALTKNLVLGLLYIVGAAVAFILLVISWRVVLELVMVLFKIDENTRKADLTAEAEATEAVEAEASQEQAISQ